ncbi:GNAT family N-acetyltransferase [Mitsuokella jalaludinii]|uniref:Phosphinothricin N-acetyltransferase n=1 Tax=Mitsuokella jalaludinii TaxID=187979 RepID=A0A174ADI6_9FIRM|nr:GNAT family N-acetyltransferase [Mitsuokella jalaludinii]CUN86474.1 Phosphinothricin N-acetyltransferase [Mitsuokella jalaludinii]
MEGNIEIRVARAQDAEALARIYAYYVEKTAITFEYEAPDAAEMEARRKEILEHYPYLVAEQAGHVLGYAYAHAFYGRAAYAWSVEVSIYVASDARGQGLGRKLYAALEDALRGMGVLNINACIAVPRAADDPYMTVGSLAFHKRLGYNMVGIFHQSGYKFGRWYDVAWMEKMLGEHEEPPAAVRDFHGID